MSSIFVFDIRHDEYAFLLVQLSFKVLCRDLKFNGFDGFKRLHGFLILTKSSKLFKTFEWFLHNSLQNRIKIGIKPLNFKFQHSFQMSSIYCEFNFPETFFFVKIKIFEGTLIRSYAYVIFVF